jgi:hypothetical protein
VLSGNQAAQRRLELHSHSCRAISRVASEQEQEQVHSSLMVQRRHLLSAALLEEEEEEEEVEEWELHSRVAVSRIQSFHCKYP